MLISLPICFNAEFIIQILGKCRLHNFYLVLLLKIRTDKVTTYYINKYYYVYLIETCLYTSTFYPAVRSVKQQGSAEFYSADILATSLANDLSRTREQNMDLGGVRVR